MAMMLMYRNNSAHLGKYIVGISTHVFDPGSDYSRVNTPRQASTHSGKWEQICC